jgi:hypothetical protein
MGKMKFWESDFLFPGAKIFSASSKTKKQGFNSLLYWKKLFNFFSFSPTIDD